MFVKSFYMNTDVGPPSYGFGFEMSLFHTLTRMSGVYRCLAGALQVP